MLYRLNQKIKFLYIKKTKLNEQLYQKHLECSALWPSSWLTMQDITHQNLQMEMESHFKKVNKKLDNLQQKCGQSAIHMDHHKTSAYPRTINLTNILFTAGKQALLDLGLQYQGG
jgi:Ser/Thr protein kinase RdoA (MazF antagonist)